MEGGYDVNLGGCFSQKFYILSDVKCESLLFCRLIELHFQLGNLMDYVVP
jgi:hypothetical protein